MSFELISKYVTSSASHLWHGHSNQSKETEERKRKEKEKDREYQQVGIVCEECE